MESERERKRGGDRKRLSRFSRLCQRKKRTRISGGEKERERGMLAADKTGLSPPLFFSQTWHPRSTVRIKIQAVPFARHANVERPARCTCTRVLHRCARHPPLLLSQAAGWLVRACLPRDLSLLVIFVAMGLCKNFQRSTIFVREILLSMYNLSKKTSSNLNEKMTKILRGKKKK